MARRKFGAKSAAIKEFIAANPKATPKVIAAAMKQQKIKVSASLIAAVKYGKGRKKAGRPSVRIAARRTSAGLSIEQLIEVKRLADTLGGADQVRCALDTLEQLQ